MRLRVSTVALGCLIAFTSVLESQQQPPGVPSTSLPSPAAREPAWAFPVQAGSLPAEPPGPKTIYLARQLYLFKDGGRKGLTDEDILNISAYLGSLDPR